MSKYILRVIGRQKLLTVSSNHLVNNVYIFNCINAYIKSNTHMPVFTNCKSLFVSNCDTKTFDNWITPTVFPKVQIIYTDGKPDPENILTFHSDVHFFIRRSLYRKYYPANVTSLADNHIFAIMEEIGLNE